MANLAAAISDAAGSVSGGSSVPDNIGSMMASCSGAVVVGVEIANATKYHMEAQGCHLAWGQLQVPQPHINPGTKEAMLGYTTGFFTTGSTGVAAWKIGNTNVYLVVLWSAPWNFNHHSNVLAIGFRDTCCHICNAAYQEMYYQKAEWFMRKEFYNNMLPIKFEDSREQFKVTGTMGNGHKCIAKITLLPNSMGAVAENLRSVVYSFMEPDSLPPLLPNSRDNVTENLTRSFVEPARSVSSPVPLPQPRYKPPPEQPKELGTPYSQDLICLFILFALFAYFVYFCYFMYEKFSS